MKNWKFLKKYSILKRKVWKFGQNLCINLVQKVATENDFYELSFSFKNRPFHIHAFDINEWETTSADLRFYSLVLPEYFLRLNLWSFGLQTSKDFFVLYIIWSYFANYLENWCYFRNEAAYILCGQMIARIEWGHFLLCIC